jgi:ferredoxin
MAKYRIEYDRDRCIGAKNCNDECPDNWEMQADGKSMYKKQEFDEADFECNFDAAKKCPVKAIHIINTETNKKII